MSRKFKIWGLLSVLVLLCGFILLVTIGILSSELHWLYYSGSDLKPSNYVIYYIEQSLGIIILASVMSGIVWAIALVAEGLKREIKGKEDGQS